MTERWIPSSALRNQRKRDGKVWVCASISNTALGWDALLYSTGEMFCCSAAVMWQRHLNGWRRHSCCALLQTCPLYCGVHSVDQCAGAHCIALHCTGGVWISVLVPIALWIPQCGSVRRCPLQTQCLINCDSSTSALQRTRKARIYTNIHMYTELHIRTYRQKHILCS